MYLSAFKGGQWLPGIRKGSELAGKQQGKLFTSSVRAEQHVLLKSGAWLHYSTPVTDLLDAFRVPFSFLIVHTRRLLPEEWFICCGIPDKFQESRLPWADSVSFASGQMSSQPVKLAEHRLLKNWTFSACKISLSITIFLPIINVLNSFGNPFTAVAGEAPQSTGSTRIVNSQVQSLLHRSVWNMNEHTEVSPH